MNTNSVSASKVANMMYKEAPILTDNNKILVSSVPVYVVLVQYEYLVHVGGFFFASKYCMSAVFNLNKWYAVTFSVQKSGNHIVRTTCNFPHYKILRYYSCAVRTTRISTVIIA